MLALAWAIVLVPSFRPNFLSSPMDGVRNFERSMGILANTRSDSPNVPGRWVMVPKGMSNPTSRRARVVERRRRMFVRLLFAAAATLVLGLLPPLRSLLLAHLAIDVVLVGYVLRLRQWAKAEQQRRRIVRRLPTSQPAAPAEAAPAAFEGDDLDERAADFG